MVDGGSFEWQDIRTGLEWWKIVDSCGYSCSLTEVVGGSQFRQGYFLFIDIMLIN